jgi:hypothetical protein
VKLPRIPRLPSRGPRDCTCGHSARAHEHYRRGKDCALCSCAKFRAGAPAKPREDVERDSCDEWVRAA